ncbi:MAG: serine O-acetyltransferase, partial [Microthrixaceae bacterium]|nr:serine O-acetyltransferase [Microthrixaceae bacterium]
MNPNATVGGNCRLHSDVVIGSKGGSSPVIGDGVWIGAGAKVFGRVTVGDGAVIGANAVVDRDVPEHTVVVGVPARAVRG